jgi:hypothetical protein
VRRDLLLFVFLAACGSRTGLLEETTSGDARADAGADAPMAADAEMDVEIDAHVFECPLKPPPEGSVCSAALSGTLCAYIGPDPGPVVEWACVGGGWVNCTPITVPHSCEYIVCSAGSKVECIAGGTECCVCSSSTGRTSQCGPCN